MVAIYASSPGSILQKNNEVTFFMTTTYFLNPKLGIIGDIRGMYGNAKIGNNACTTNFPPPFCPSIRRSRSIRFWAASPTDSMRKKSLLSPQRRRRRSAGQIRRRRQGTHLSRAWCLAVDHQAGLQPRSQHRLQLLSQPCLQDVADLCRNLLPARSDRFNPWASGNDSEQLWIQRRYRLSLRQDQIVRLETKRAVPIRAALLCIVLFQCVSNTGHKLQAVVLISKCRIVEIVVQQIDIETQPLIGWQLQPGCKDG